MKQTSRYSTAFSLDHIIRMTDNVGILEHCIFATPDKTQGYTTDDNARALQVALKIDAPPKKKEELIITYLKFIISARNKNGFRNDLGPDLQWEDKGGTGEWFGRAMEALGETMTLAHDNLKLTAAFVFDQQSPFIKNSLNLRTNAHLIIALAHRLRFETVSPHLLRSLIMRKKLGEYKNEISQPSIPFKSEIIRLADDLVESYKHNREESWRWFEQSLTYDNGRLPMGLFSAYVATGKKIYLQIAQYSLNFLIEKTYNTKRGCFSFPGYRNWYPKNGEMALFGQQPIEAGSMAEICTLAYQLTKRKSYLELAIKSLEWYRGKNILGINLLDEETGGVRDGLEPWGVNPNEGAESVLSFATACLSLNKIQP